MPEPSIHYDRSRASFVLEGILREPVFFKARFSCREPGSRELRTVPAEPGGEGGLGLTLDGEPVEGGIELRPRIRCFHQPVRLHSVEILDVAGRLPGFEDPGSTRIFQHGYQSWSTNHVLRGDARPVRPWFSSFSLMNHAVDSPFWGRRDGVLSSLFTLLRPRPGAEALLFGFTSQERGLGEIFLRTRGDGGLVCALDLGGRALEGEEELVCDGLWIAAGEPGALRDTWADQIGRRMGARIPPRSVTGWCTWYEFYDRIRPEQVRRNLAALRERPRLGVEVVQLDDGYQAAVGDWRRFGKRFPEGPARLMEEIAREGFTPGLWLAPFMASPRSELVRKHPDWLLRDERGRPVDCGYNPVWGCRVLALDLSHPGMQAQLRETLQAMVEWGVRHFKLDFLFAGARHGRFAGGPASPVEVYRKGLALCREVVGEERTLLGCGAPIGPSIGLVDAMRVSEDVKEEWNSLLASFAGRGCGYPSARGSIANNVHRAFTHGRWWRNDPDGLIVRAHDSRLAPDEVETHATVLGMSGGLVFLNDDLTRLEPERLHLAEGLLPPCARPAFAREGLAEEFPPLLEIEGDLARGAGTVAGAPRRLLAFLNLGESWVERSVPEGVIGGSFFDFWREEMASVLRPGSDLSRSPRIVVPPRGVRALLWTPWLGRPALVGGSFHLTALVDGRMREFFSEEGGDGLALLHVECDALARSRGRLWLGVPARYGLLVDRLPRGVSVKEILPSRSVLDVDLAPPFSFDLLFATIGPSEGVR